MTAHEGSEDAQATEPTPPSLRPLSPQFNEAHHGPHATLLVQALLKPPDQGPRNIAVTGHYGSGKSSVLGEVERRFKLSEYSPGKRKFWTKSRLWQKWRLWRKRHRVVNVSVPSLGLGCQGSQSGDRDATTNTIQKEIVKQLLYRKAPSSMPASRYRRLTSVRWRTVVSEGAGVALLAGVIGFLADVPSRIGSLLPAALGQDLAWPRWSGLAILALMAGAIWMIGRWRIRHSRVSEVVAGPTKVTLENQNNSYFDEYLDEIVEFDGGPVGDEAAGGAASGARRADDEQSRPMARSPVRPSRTVFHRRSSATATTTASPNRAIAGIGGNRVAR
ncbi:YobI family P-loop NTPase [Streptomonospora wellingtoniae]|uniref:YobI-like P-loop NTPase domain-containing protein n=1 Tax=Streptomonospora wellingtoniae TaxID=3075544 RepID=A0ABU2KPU1_9ACTN|nr:hypothetical protein [Streptomonospora sp. DSM 45055]MDT0301294.1 hypothetical protein [Streptomonospora sp. DSM 45055]